MDYTIIIGLEVHVQLQTESKMFSACGTEFGLPPNTQTDPVSLGLPGTLPVMNRKAFELALKTAVALDCRDRRRSPSGTARTTTIPTCPRTIRSASTTCRSARQAGSTIPGRKDGGGRRAGVDLTRVHLEEDTGKLHARRRAASPRSTSTARASRCWRSSPSPTSAARRTPRRASKSSG